MRNPGSNALQTMEGVSTASCNLLSLFFSLAQPRDSSLRFPLKLRINVTSSYDIVTFLNGHPHYHEDVANTESHGKATSRMTCARLLTCLQSFLAARLSSRSVYVSQRSFAVYAAVRKRTGTQIFDNSNLTTYSRFDTRHVLERSTRIQGSSTKGFRC